MREIRFRAWDVKGKEMYLMIQNHINDKVFAFGYMIKNEERFKIMQYTGLKDKNCKEIYEGDICKCIYPKHNEPDLKLIQYVDFEKGTFFFKTKDADDIDYEYTYRFIEMYAGYKIEIIGNIYESPELLT